MTRFTLACAPPPSSVLKDIPRSSARLLAVSAPRLALHGSHLTKRVKGNQMSLELLGKPTLARYPLALQPGHCWPAGMFSHSACFSKEADAVKSNSWRLQVSNDFRRVNC